MAAIRYGVTGYKQTMRDLLQVDKETRRDVRTILRHVGDTIKTDSAHRIAKYDAKSAAGVKTYVRQRGVAVEQSIRKTTGRRPDFGTLQMRKGFLPAKAEHMHDLEHDIEHALDEIAARFNRTGEHT